MGDGDSIVDCCYLFCVCMGDPMNTSVGDMILLVMASILLFLIVVEALV